jgi:hypothetical protein
MENGIISPNQTTFMKGRYILDGSLALLEIVDGPPVKKTLRL